MFNQYFKKRRINKGTEIEDSIMTITEKEKANIEAPYKKKGLLVIWYGIVFLLIVLAGRVFYLDFFKGEHYAEISRENRIRSIVINAPRGNILDKYGKVLARSVPGLDAVLIPSDLPESFEERKRMALILAETLEMNYGNIEIMMESQDKKIASAFLLKENITQDEALILAEKSSDLPGIAVNKTAIRSYENSNIFSHILGYDGKITKDELDKNPGYLMTDYIGKAGIEKSYEVELRGVHGARQVEIDSMGNVKKDLGTVIPQSGSDLILNIDEGLQKKLYDSLVSISEQTESKTAAAVAIDPRNGGVLAMVSLPSYDNNSFAQGIGNEEYKELISNKDLPLLNRTINGEYPPGSTLKMAVAAAALSEGTINEDTTVGCGGAINIGS
ncbi:MAG TPA: penicillin-binding transpeptidase domain-containing protein, partial [Candidatus Moranbacteria bacterium]|nr:penicillin-binding transpeptidase domain-containing protein [Candidatus Moranbacteria bacterium]